MEDKKEFLEAIEELEKDDEFKELTEDNEELAFIMDNLSAPEKKQILSHGYNMEEVKKMLTVILNMFKSLEGDIPQFDKQYNMVLELLHSNVKKGKERMFKEMKKEMKSGITLEDYYNKIYRDFELKYADKFAETRYNEKEKKSFQIGARLTVCTLFMLSNSK